MRMLRVRPIVIILLLLLIILQYELWFEPTGVIKLFNMKRALSVQEQKNQVLQKRNQKLSEQVRALKNGDQALEERARHDLGMVKKGEQYYQVVNDAKRT